MKLLLDTQMLIWVSNSPEQLPARAHDMLNDPGSELFFSPISIWEVAIKYSLNRADFRVNPRILHKGLLENDYHELYITSSHAVAVSDLPALHKDPFDRILIAQAKTEGIKLITCDTKIANYSAPILFIAK